MKCRSLWRRSLAALIVLGLGPAFATASGVGSSGASSGIPGNAEILLNPALDPLVKVLVNQPDANGVSHPFHVAQPAGQISGWNIKDVRLRYLSDSDTMIVGVNSFGIFGDADGDGVPGKASTPNAIEYPHLGGRQSVTVALDTNKDGVYDVVAGVPAQLPNPLNPASKTEVPGSGLNGFLVSKYRGGAIQYGYGTHLPEFQGELVADPSTEDPDFIFTVKNFSKLPGIVSPYNFSIKGYAGSPDDIIAGEDSFIFQNVQLPLPQNVPEPATVLAWGLVAGLVALRARRVRRPIHP